MSFQIYCFEIGYLFKHAATFFQVLKMLKKKNSECISLETFVLFLIGSLSRMIWTFDSLLKDYFLNYVELTLSVFLLGYAIYLQQKYVESNYCINDVKLPIFLKLYVLIPVVFVLSLLFNPP